MRSIALVATVIALLAAACVTDESPPFADKGRGVWSEMQDAPPMPYLAVWGSGPADVIAVGDGGGARFDGQSWRTADDIPAGLYRAIWGRSAEQVWIGGDGVMLARSPTGWQRQPLFDRDVALFDYAVLAIAGDAGHEYALVRTGARLLLLINRGSSWETPLWRGGGGATLPFSVQPSLYARAGSLLIAGDGPLFEARTTSDLGVPLWEAATWRDRGETIEATAIAGADDFWVAAGARDVVFTEGFVDPVVASDSRARISERRPRAVFAASANRAFVVGDRLALADPDPQSGVMSSSVEACDRDGCALERIADDGERPLRAVWSDPAGNAIAVGDHWVVRRGGCRSTAGGGVRSGCR